MPKRIAAALALCIAGCASPPAVDSQFLTGQEKGRGVVVFSTTHTGNYHDALAGHLRFRCASGVTGSVADHHARAHYIDGESIPIPIPRDFQLDAARPKGRLHMLELPAGSCEFTSWYGASHGMNVVASGGTTLSIRFTVTDNRTVYIGGFNIHWSGRAGRPSFADHFDRDLAALKRQKVPLPGAGIAKQLASTTAL